MAVNSVHWPQTLIRKGRSKLAYKHLRYRRRKFQSDKLYCLLLDCSGSMLQQHKLSIAKGLINQLSQQVYKQRAQLAVIGFRSNEVRVIKAPGKLTAFNKTWIGNIQGGGSTPLGEGIHAVEEVMQRYKCQFPGRPVECWLLTDGRFRDLPSAPIGAVHYSIVDFEDGRLRLGRAQRLAQQWQADYLHAEDLIRVNSYE